MRIRVIGQILALLLVFTLMVGNIGALSVAAATEDYNYIGGEVTAIGGEVTSVAPLAEEAAAQSEAAAGDAEAPALPESLMAAPTVTPSAVGPVDSELMDSELMDSEPTAQPEPSEEEPGEEEPGEEEPGEEEPGEEEPGEEEPGETLSVDSIMPLASTNTFDLAAGKWANGASLPTDAGAGAADPNKCWLQNDTYLFATDGADITVTGTSITGTGDGVRRIVVASDSSVHITLRDVNITCTGGYQSPILLESGADATITLAGTNTLMAGSERAGIGTTGATLTIDGGGSLEVTGGDGSAGIGGGYGGAGGTVTINSGTVTATGRSEGAGIGGGCMGMGGNVIINGGTVEAICGASGGMAIGHGYASNVNGTLTVDYSPNSYAWLHNTTNSASGAAQGIGELNTSSNIKYYRYLIIMPLTIVDTNIFDLSTGKWSDGTSPPTDKAGGVANSNKCWLENDTYLQVLDGAGITVTGTSAAGSGDGVRRIVVASGATVHITLWNVIITCSNDNQSPILLESDANATITLSGTNILEAGVYRAGIGTTDATLIIDGDGSLKTTGGYFGAGIGGNNSGAGGNVTINDGNVTAVGGDYSAGIGGGSYGTGGTVTISGGKVTAIGDEGGGAGIGGGKGGIGGTVIINGGTVEAIAGTGFSTPKPMAIGYGLGGDSRGSLLVDYSPYVYGWQYNTTNDASSAVQGIGNLATDRDLTSYGYLKIMAIPNIFNLATGTWLDGTPLPTDTDGGAADAKSCWLESNTYLWVMDGADIIVTGTSVAGGSNGVRRIAVPSGATVTITLQDANITCTSEEQSPILLEPGADATLVLTGTNILRARGIRAGIGTTGATLTIDGDGSLEATGGYFAAGIGGGNESAGGTVIINSGTVTATGGSEGAGIGGGQRGSGGIVTINGGTVTATGGTEGAGIGGGQRGNGSTVTIAGGTVIANGNVLGAGIGGGITGTGGNVTISGGSVTAIGGDSGAGIGSGAYSEGGDVIISGGTITATGGSRGAGIGSGALGAGGNVTISGGNVTATGGSKGAGIGGGDTGAGATVTLRGGIVEAIGGTDGGMAIGSGNNKTDKGTLSVDYTLSYGWQYNITNSATGVSPGSGELNTETNLPSYRYLKITRMSVAGTNTFNLATGKWSDGTSLPIDAAAGEDDHNKCWLENDTFLHVLDGAVITVTGTSVEGSSSGVRSIKVASGARVSITLWDVNITCTSSFQSPILLDSGADAAIMLVGTNTLTALRYEAGIGIAGAALTIDGDGSLTATGGERSAGIGGGDRDVGGAVTINGGNVTAGGGVNGAGIGGGSHGAGGTVTINGGTVTANGGPYSAGIGGGFRGTGGTVIINDGGTVTATGGSYGAGIGSGGIGGGGGVTVNGGNVTINGGTVTATGGSYGAGIGGGDGGAGGRVIINGGTVEAICGRYGIGMAIGNGDNNTDKGTLTADYSPDSYTWLFNTVNTANGAAQGSGGLSTSTNLKSYRYLRTQAVRQNVLITGAVITSKLYDGTGGIDASAVTPTFNDPVIGNNYTVSAARVTGGNFSVGTGRPATFTVTLTGPAAQNYNLPNAVYTGATVDITERPLTITGVTAGTRAYDEGNTTVALTGGALRNVAAADAGDTARLSFKLGSGTIANADAGTDKSVTTAISLTGTSAGNYTLTQPTGITVNITKADQAPLTITPVAEQIYQVPNAAIPLSTGTTGSGTGAVSYTVVSGPGTVSGSTLTITGAGSIVVRAAKTADANYNAITSDTLTITVKKGSFTLSGAAKSVRYSDTAAQTVNLAVFVADKLAAGDSLTYTPGTYTDSDGILTAGATAPNGVLTFTIAGGLAISDVNKTATIPVIISGFTNYENVTVNVVITITDTMAATVTVTPPAGITYGQTLGDPSASAGGDGSTFTYSYSGSLADGTGYGPTDVKPTKPGSYTVTAALDSPTHQGSDTAGFTITPKPLTWNTDGTVTSKNYDGTITAAISNHPTLNGVINGDDVTVAAGTAVFSSANAGAGVTASGWGITGTNAAFYVAPTVQPVFTGTIGKLPAPVITWPIAAAITYGAALSTSALSGGSTQYGTFAWTNGTIIPNVNNKGYSVTFTPNASTLQNYEAISLLTRTVSITVSKAAYTGTITAADSVRAGQTTAGKTLTLPPLPDGASYDTVSPAGALIDGTPTVSGTTLTYSTTSQPDGTTAAITITVTGAANFNDYSIVVTVTATVLIPQNISFPNENASVTKTYGDAAYTHEAGGGAGTGAITYESSNTAVATVNATSGLVTITGAGITTITAIMAADSSYAKAAASYALTVKKKIVTVKADDKTARVGDALPTATVSYDGFAGTDSAVNALSVRAIAAHTATNTSTVGNFPIEITTPAVLNAGIGKNYTLTHQDGTLTVSNTIFTISFDANGVTVSPASVQTGTDGRLLSLPTPTRNGYTFSGWFTAVSGGTQVTTATVFTASTTVYARWTPGSTYDPAPAQTQYPVISHPGTWSGNGNVSGKINAPYHKFVRIVKDGDVIDPIHYTVSEDSTIITFKQSYLNTLALGTHTFRVEFTDGYADLTLFVNLNLENVREVPKTGDSNNMTGWLMVLILSAAGIAFAFAQRRRKKVR